MKTQRYSAEEVMDSIEASWMKPKEKKAFPKSTINNDANAVVELVSKHVERFHLHQIFEETKTEISLLKSNFVELKKLIVDLQGKIESRNVLVLNLRSEKYTLSNPISVVFEYTPEGIVASCYDLNMFGEGITEDEALTDLCEIIVEYYEMLKSEKLENLGKIPTIHYNYLRLIIK